MEGKGIAVALADELLHTVIHKFQIPKSGVQLKVQAIAIKELMALLEKHSDIRFPGDIYELVDIVRDKMPACYGGVPDDFYKLRRNIEAILSQDETLRHVVKVQIVRGCRDDLYVLLPVLKNPQISQEFKEELMEGNIVAVFDRETLESAVALIDLLGGKDKEKMELYVATGAQAADAGSEMTEATINSDFEKLRNLDLDLFGMMEAQARIDQVLGRLFSHYLSELYDERR